MEFGIALELENQKNNSKDVKTIKLTPINAIGLDGRKFKIEPDYVIFNSQKYSKILIRLEHGENRDALDKSIGWIDGKSLRVENDFIVGDVEFTEWGKTLINNKEYRYLSPEFLIDDMVDGFYVVNAIAGLGLVNRPNFKTLALNNQKDNQNKMDEKETKIKALELELEQIKKENNSLKIKNLIADGKILQSQESFALSLNAQQLDIFVQNNFEVMSNLTRLKGLTTVNQVQNETGKKEYNSTELEVFRQLGIKK